MSRNEVTEAVVIDMSAWAPDITYDEGLVLCERLGLIEQLQHGGHGYGRLTQDGRNALATLMVMAANAANPKNVLKGS